MADKGGKCKQRKQEGSVVFGFIFRLGTRIKDYGERMAAKKVFGIPLFRWCCGPVICLGLAIRNSIMGFPIGEM